jgi:hypothetical protein
MNTATVKAANLKPGMVLLDPVTEAPAFEIDHKLAAIRGTGMVRFFGVDLDTHRYSEVQLSPKVALKVARDA